jgi:hypothetical protein
VTAKQAKGPKIVRAQRGGEWDANRSDVEAYANKGTLRNLKELGYTKIVVEMEFDIEALLKQADDNG